MTNYRVRIYVHHSLNYHKVQEQVWWGWKTVARNILRADNAAQVVRDLLEIEKEFENDREGPMDNIKNRTVAQSSF